MVSHGRVLCFVLSLATLLAASTSTAQSPTFAEVMRRVHEYVTVYEDHELSTVIAHERYFQQLLDGRGTPQAERTLLSDYLLVQLPDEDWVALRDVYDVDGIPAGDRGARLKALFAGPRQQLGERAMRMAEDATTFNLGGELYYRTVNLPTFALRVLRPAHRKRIEFSKSGEELVGNTTTWIVAFRETKGPTFSGKPDGSDIPAQGRFWVDPTTGVVVRSEMVLGGTRNLPARATITVNYRLEPSLGFRLPFEMRERYDNPRRKGDDVVTAQATYSEFRSFDWRAYGRGNAGR